MKIGDRVRVVGPDDSGFEDLIGTEFEIAEAWKNGGVMKFSAIGVPFFPESSLRLVEDARSTFEYPTTPAKDFEELSLRDVARMNGICKNEYGVWISTHLSRLAAIQKRQGAQQNRMDDLLEDYRDFKDLVLRVHDRVTALESRLHALDDAHDESCRAFRAHIREMLPICKEEPEPKVGDWVEVFGPVVCGYSKDIDHVFRLCKISNQRRLSDARRLNR